MTTYLHIARLLVCGLLAAIAFDVGAATERPAPDDRRTLQQAVAKLGVPGAILHNPDATGDGAEYDNFGTALVIDGDTAFIGSTGAYSAGARGAVLVLRRTAGVWTETDRLLPDPSVDVESFGQAIAVSGNTVVVSAPAAATAAGADRGVVYVFVREQGVWRRQARLQGGPSQFDQGFGSAVALDGDVLLVGAPTAAVQSILSGAVLEFRARVIGECAGATSDSALVNVCAVDYTCDHRVDSADFFEFLTRFFALDSGGDFNADGFINSQDFFEFMSGFFQGCCRCRRMARS